MSVVVIGMEMPSCCSECELNYDSLGCSAIRSDGAFDRPGFDMDTERLPNCPLRPLPNVHGDLIDRDALPSRVEWEDIVNAPAIVVAEGKEPIKITGKIYFVDGHVYIDLDKEDKP